MTTGGQRVICLGLLAAVLPPLAACRGAASDGPLPLAMVGGEDAHGKLSGRLTITGSSTLAPLASEIAKRFEQQHPRVRIDVQMGGTARGIADARRGLADIGMVSRDLKADEADLYAWPIARDGICLIVHSENPVVSLTEIQIVGIYTGRIRNWAEVGGDDLPITTVAKAQGRSTLELFLHHFQLQSTDIDADVVTGDNRLGISTVAANRGAIGFVSIGAAEYDAARGVPIKLLPLAGAAPTTESILNGGYPLARTLNLVTKEPPQGLARHFIDFAQADAVEDLVARQYFVSLPR